MTYWQRSLQAHLAAFWAEPQVSLEHQQAIDWLKGLEAYLEAAPDVVKDASSLDGMHDALSDLEGDVTGHYRKGEGR